MLESINSQSQRADCLCTMHAVGISIDRTFVRAVRGVVDHRYINHVTVCTSCFNVCLRPHFRCFSFRVDDGLSGTRLYKMQSKISLFVICWAGWPIILGGRPILWQGSLNLRRGACPPNLHVWRTLKHKVCSLFNYHIYLHASTERIGDRFEYVFIILVSKVGLDKSCIFLLSD